MPFESFAQADLPTAQRRDVTRLVGEAWPSESGPDHDPRLNPVWLILRVDADAVAALAVLSSSLVHAGQTFRVSGLSTVVTARAHRGRGYGYRLVVEARARIADGGADAGLFTCDRELAPFYERAGWSVSPGSVLIGGTATAPFPSDQVGFDKVVLASFFTEHGRLWAGSFAAARIGLYPGDVDRLW